MLTLCTRRSSKYLRHDSWVCDVPQLAVFLCSSRSHALSVAADFRAEIVQVSATWALTQPRRMPEKITCAIFRAIGMMSSSVLPDFMQVRLVTKVDQRFCGCSFVSIFDRLLSEWKSPVCRSSTQGSQFSLWTLSSPSQAVAEPVRTSCKSCPRSPRLPMAVW